MGEDGIRERLRRKLDSTENDDLRYHLRSALQHLDIDRQSSNEDRRR
ncbi:hypothetical protein [Halanaeroarchaeum sp. HSR-CO]|nr:hypothetical protein [Halanaeroarchaeum sp. HSR-CO]